jgi:hypothetical protein
MPVYWLNSKVIPAKALLSELPVFSMTEALFVSIFLELNYVHHQK